MWQKGDIVSVKAYPDTILQRRVVGVLDDRTILLCNEREFNEALNDEREPDAIGFPISDVIMAGNEREAEKRT
jgi:hypothetical protein